MKEAPLNSFPSSLPSPALRVVHPQATATALFDAAMIASIRGVMDVFAQTQARAFAAARQTPQATQVRGRVSGLPPYGSAFQGGLGSWWPIHQRNATRFGSMGRWGIWRKVTAQAWEFHWS